MVFFPPLSEFLTCQFNISARADGHPLPSCQANWGDAFLLQLFGDWESQTRRVMKMIAGGGLSITGSHNMCGDYLYSGHTVMLTLTYLFIKECKYHSTLVTLMFPTGALYNLNATDSAVTPCGHVATCTTPFGRSVNNYLNKQCE